MESGEPLGPAPQCPLAHDGRQMLSMTVPIGVDDLFTLLFTNSSFFMDFLQTTRKSTGSCPRYLLLVDFVFNLSVVFLIKINVSLTMFDLDKNAIDRIF